MDKKNKNPNVPNLRFDFHSPWKMYKVGNIIESCGGGTPSTKIISYWQGDIPWISSSDLFENNIRDINVSRYITKEAIKCSATKFCPKETICIVSRVGVGKVAVTTESLCTSQDFMNITHFDGNKYFLAQLIQNKIKSSQLQGTSIKGITSKEIKDMKLFIPSRAEQDQIVGFLNIIDQRIETQIKIIDALISQRKSIFLQHDSKIKKNELVINDLGKMNNGCNLSKEDIAKSGKSCILYGELFTKYDHVVNNVISNTQKTNEKTLYSKKHNLVFPSSTTVDAFSLICPVSLNIEGVILGGDLFNIEIYPAFNSDYFSYLINFKYKKTLSRYAKGTTIIHLHYEDIKNVKLQVACLEEQNKIARVMELITEKIDKENKLLELLKNQKAYLLDNLFI